MTERRHAEIAGGGLAGLFTAITLARHGWSVRVHEHSPELREIGGGVGVWDNGLWALRQVDVYEQVLSATKPDPIHAWEIYDDDERCLQSEWMNPGFGRAEKYTLLRPDLHRALANAAVNLGVEIKTGSPVAGATPEGELLIEGGERLRADLIIGADGVNSRVRESVGLTIRVDDLKDGGGRHLVARKPGEFGGKMEEHWNGARRVGFVTLSSDWIYVYLACPANDVHACAQGSTKDLEPWMRSFPRLRHLLERIPDGGRWAPFLEVHTSAWSVGKVVLVGDAAHGMAPSLGQAINVGWCNAVALAHALDGVDESAFPAALQLWERRERPNTDRTQLSSRWYNTILIGWPRPFAHLRSKFISGLSQSPQIQQMINPAVKYRPDLSAYAQFPQGASGDGRGSDWAATGAGVSPQ